jgi:hypothetical protein
MDLRTFFDEQNVQPNELNDMQAAIETALSRGNYEHQGYGVLYGMGLGPTSPAAMAVKVTKGVAYYNANATTSSDSGADIKASRITLAADVSKTLTVDYLGAATSVSPGQERWLAIVAIPARVDSDPRTDGAGSPVNFVNTESGSVIIMKGSSAAVGSATKVSPAAVRALGVRLGDILINNSTTTVTDPSAFDLNSREQISHLLHPDDDGNGNGAQASLFWQSFRSTSGAAAGAGIIRAYTIRHVTGGPPAGITVTFNTFWDHDQQLWVPDSSFAGNGPCMALRFQTNGFLFTQRTQGVSAGTGWPDTTDGRWSDVTSPGNDESVLMSALGLNIFGNAKSALLKSNGVITASGGANGVDDSAVTVLVGFQGQSGDGALSPISCFASFPRPFTVTDKFDVSVTGTEYAEPGSPFVNRVGPSQDLNVNTGVTFGTQVTPYGVSVSFIPTDASTYTRFSRLVTVTRRSS